MQYAPPAVLRNYVRYFWSFDASQNTVSQLHIKSFADRYPRLIFQNLNDFAPLRNLEGEQLPVCYLSGIDTRPTDALMGGSFSHFGVSFYPHALTAFFEIESTELLNTMPDIQLLCKIPITQQLEQATTHIERVQCISQYLYQKLEASRSNDLLVNHLLHSQHLTSHTSLHTLHQAYDLSERQLQRRFKAHVGLPPKRFQRLIRFEKALHLLAHADYSQLTAIAYELGYTDQSHFIRDFTEFSGMSPYAFVRSATVGSESASYIYLAD